MSLLQHQRLKSDSFGWAGQFFQSMAHMAPAVALIMTAPYMASRAGEALPLASLFGMILAVMLAYCLGLLTRKYYGASGYFQIHSRALGSRAGFVTSWLFFLYEPINPFVTFFGFGVLVLEPFSEAFLGYRIPWWMGVTGGNFIVAALALTKVKNSVRMTALLGLLEFVIMLALGIVLVVRSDAPFQPHTFSPAASADGMGGLMFAFIFGFLMFVGYESGLPMTEETKDSKSATFKGLMLSVLLAGLFYTFMGYATVVGFGGGEDTLAFAKAFSTAENPYGSTLAVKAFGILGPWLVFFAAVNSTLSCTLASQNSATRVFFALGRAGVLPRWLGVVTRQDKIPLRAVLFSSALTFVLTGATYALMPEGRAMEWFGFAAVLLTLPLLLIHLVTCASVYVAYRHREKGDFRLLHHGVIPLVTGALVLLPIWGAIHYNPDPPMSYAPWCVLAWFVVGILVYAILKRRRPESLAMLDKEMDLLAHKEVG